MGLMCFNLVDFSRLYLSFIDYCGMSKSDALYFAYTLNTANIDTVRSACNRAVRECSYPTFARLIQHAGRPYRNLLSFYESMDLLDDSISTQYLTDGQRAAYARLHGLMRDVRCMYKRCYGVELDDAILTCDMGKRSLYCH